MYLVCQGYLDISTRQTLTDRNGKGEQDEQHGKQIRELSSYGTNYSEKQFAAKPFVYLAYMYTTVLQRITEPELP